MTESDESNSSARDAVRSALGTPPEKAEEIARRLQEPAEIDLDGPGRSGERMMREIEQMAPETRPVLRVLWNLPLGDPGGQ